MASPAANQGRKKHPNLLNNSPHHIPPPHPPTTSPHHFPPPQLTTCIPTI
ncbi:hypothetical protein [Rubritalea tangerina]